MQALLSQERICQAARKRLLTGLGVTAALSMSTPAVADDLPEVTLTFPTPDSAVLQVVEVPESEHGTLTSRPESTAPQVAQASEPATQTEPPEITIITDRGGVLTPQGGFVLEPSIEYTNASSQRLNFRGISIVEGILIGAIEAVDADRDSVTAALTARYGVTNRFEIEAKVPYVVRDDDVTTTLSGSDITSDVDGDGLGDIEVAAHYQINDGRDGWPFFIANLRYKSNTGDGPFDVDRDVNGIATELATGSGFHSVEPSVTAIYPTDPAVLFANVSYTFNFEDDVDKTIAGDFIGDVDPGDAVGLTFGVGFALNEELSLSLGYQHDWVFETDTEINGTTTESDDFSVGSFLLGGSFRLNDRVGINLTTQIGATEDAPDVQLILRVPILF